MERLDRHTDPAPVREHLKRARGALAFDVGANIGQSTRVLCEGFGRVVALEPCTESHAILAAEMPSKVATLCLAVSDHEGKITLAEAQTSIRTGQLVSHEGLHWGPLIGERIVSAVTLDLLALQFGAPDFVKIDTEGHECEVVRGGQLLFAGRRPGVVIEVHRRENEATLRALLPDYAFRKVEHEGLRPDSPIRQDHFWLLGEPT